MKKFMAAVGIIVFAGLLAAGCSDRSQGWYNYGNGCVNLANVTHISSSMSFELTLPEQNEYGQKKVVSLAQGESITQENVDKIISELKKYAGKWESVSTAASIQFDAFTLQLYTLKSAGLPATDEGCVKLVGIWLSEYNKLAGSLK